MAELHPLLRRQLARWLEGPPPAALEGLLGAISRAYEQHDGDRTLLERSLELSSQELFQANSELLATLQALPDLVLAVSPDGRVRDRRSGPGAPEQERLLAELRARLEAACTGAEPGSLASVLVSVREEGERRTCELELRLGERDHHVELRLAALPSGDVLCVARDVSERLRYERSLREARDAAEDAARAKSEFLATMSHEIRTPLNGMVGVTGLLGETRLDEEQRELVQIAHGSAETLLALLNDVLDMSKLEAGRTVLEEVELDLFDVVEDALELFVPRAHQKGLELVAQLDPALESRFLGDPGRLRQVLCNLIGNALKFTPQGSVIVRARELARDGSGARVALEVEDTGIGIAAEVQPLLFQPFTQADSSTTRRFGGTGLGLAISRQLVGLMGGELRLASEVGRGSTFTIELRLACAPASGERAPRLDGLEVLCAQLGGAQAGAVRAMLEAAGARVLGAADLASALRLLSEAAERGCPLPVALADRELAGGGGLALAHAARAILGERAPRLVLVTPLEGSTAACQPAGGADACLRRPVRRRALLEAVLRLASPAPAAPAAAEEPAAALAPASPAPLAGRGAHEERAPSAPGASGTPATSGAPRRELAVLLVEDNPVNQRVAQRLLEALGLAPALAVHGEEALALLATRPFDLVLMDCQMPVLDGYEATRRLRAREAGSAARTLVVAMTANAMEGDRERCLAAGMDDYLAKPVRKRDLAELLERHFPPAPARDEPAAPLPERSAGSAGGAPAAGVRAYAPDARTVRP